MIDFIIKTQCKDIGITKNQEIIITSRENFKVPTNNLINYFLAVPLLMQLLAKVPKKVEGYDPIAGFMTRDETPRTLAGSSDYYARIRFGQICIL